ncbi:isochorismatase family protein, partial [uncultured Microbacterium sp.]
MIEICGKPVRDTFAELLDPTTTALVVIDMQKGAVSKGGAIADSGHDMSMMPRIVDQCARAIRAARAAGVPVFHICVENLPDGRSSTPAWLRALYTVGHGRSTDLGRLSAKGDPLTEFTESCAP